MTTSIEIPAPWLARAKAMLEIVEIPEFAIPGILQEWLITDALADDPWLWFTESGYVYPDRATAERVAGRFFAANWGHERQEVSYRIGRKITYETFTNPRLTKASNATP